MQEKTVFSGYATAVIILLLSLLTSAPALAACERGRFTVALDAGHTPGDAGSTSARGKKEFDFNDRLAREALTALQSAGFSKAFLVNPYRKELSLHSRTRIADEQGAQLMLSIHHDSVQPHYLSSWTHAGADQKFSDQFSGFSLWVSQTNSAAAGSLVTAKAIGTGLVRRGLSPTLHHAEPIPGESRTLLDASRGIYGRDDLAVLRTSTPPAVLVEAGVIVHRAEEARLEQRSHRAKIAAALVEGVAAACMAGG
jgi:N-acetylmuramoyl-L-alanine amidase